MKKIYNFSSELAMLPEEVLLRAYDETLNYRGRGISTMEIAPASAEFFNQYRRAEASLRAILNIPQNYKIFFLHGGAESQFAAIPMNLLSGRRAADYILTGLHAKSASIEAKKYGDIAIAASSAGAMPTFSTVPETTRSDFRPDADYVHICFSSSIYGTKFHYIPDTGSVPLVANMSGYLFSEPFELSKFGCIYAAADNTIGVSGMNIVILRDDLLSSANPSTPSMLNYKLISEDKISYNTPPTFSLYIANLMFDWILSNGGLEEMKRRSERKASLLYDFIDSQSYYTTTVDKKCRSNTNVLFITGDAGLDRKFIAEAQERGLINLSGHESIGGMCAALYNGMPYEGVIELVKFMKSFMQENPKIEA